MSQTLSLKRVPWSNPIEFLQVFDLLFSTTNPQPEIGLLHLHAWSLRSPSSLPPAIQSTHALLSLIILPDSDQQLGPTRRLALAMALTRLVNSLVDPLQTNMFARSIAELARQLDLPLSLVQLRHRSTHEDLPSEQVLLDSARIAVDWLYTRYWYPHMNQILSATSQPGPSTHDGPSAMEDIDGLRNLLKQYKTARKRELIDATQSQSTRQLIIKLEGWVEQRVVRQIPESTLEGPSEGGEEFEEIEHERRTMEALVVELCAVGCLVPQAVKKRPQKINARLSPSLRDLYQPLLLSLNKGFPQTLLRTLSNHLVGVLISIAPEHHHLQPQPTPTKTEETYYLSCAAWLVEVLPLLDRITLEELVKCLLGHPNIYSLSVLKMLNSADGGLGAMCIQGLQPALAVLQLALNLPPVSVTSMEGAEQELDYRRHRWETACQRSPETEGDTLIEEAEEHEEEPTNVFGWKVVDKHDWSACPIGMLPGRRLPQLHDLP